MPPASATSFSAVPCPHHPPSSSRAWMPPLSQTGSRVWHHFCYRAQPQGQQSWFHTAERTVWVVHMTSGHLQRWAWLLLDSVYVKWINHAFLNKVVFVNVLAKHLWVLTWGAYNNTHFWTVPATSEPESWKGAGICVSNQSPPGDLYFGGL